MCTTKYFPLKQECKSISSCTISGCFCLVEHLFTRPNKKSSGVKSRDLDGLGSRSARPLHRFPKRYSSKLYIDVKNVETLNHPEWISWTLPPKERPPLKAAVRPSGSTDNCHKLNIVPKRMVQSTDHQSDHTKHYLRIDIERCFQRSCGDYRRITSSNFVYCLFIPA